MKNLKRVLLTVAIPLMLVVTMLTLCSCDAVSTLEQLLSEKPEEGSKWVYTDFSFETEDTSGAGVTLARASAQDAARGFLHEVYNPTTESGEKYYDTLTFEDGKITRLHYTRQTSKIDGMDVYTHVDEETLDWGEYKGKKITIDEEDFVSAHIKDGVLYVKLSTYHNDTTFAILQFELAD